MIIINTRKELRTAKQEVKKLVEKSLQNLKKQGFKLSRGVWSCSYTNSVCLVGAIGVLEANSEVSESLEPSVVAPLIKNGASKWVHDDELLFLSDGFEGNAYHSLKTLLNWEPARTVGTAWHTGELGYLGLTLTPKQTRWTEEYHIFLYQLGKQIGEKYAW